jgi:hypothetical protein
VLFSSIVIVVGHRSIVGFVPYERIFYAKWRAASTSTKFK